jgi:hypothetical protein
MMHVSTISDDGSTPAFVPGMLRPDFYPHETKRQVGLVQTHIYYLFRTGPN